MSSTSRSRKRTLSRKATRFGERPQQVEKHLDAVAAEVGHGPATGLAPAQQPRARVIGPGVEGLEGLDLGQHRLADLARRDEPPQAGDQRVVVPVVRDAQPHAVGTGGRQHPLAGGDVEGHRLLAQHVLARLGGGDRLLGVEAHRRRQVDGVDLAVLQHVPPVHVPAPRPVALGELRSELGPGAGHGDEGAPFGLAQGGGHALPGDVAAPDEAPPDDAHARLSHLYSCVLLSLISNRYVFRSRTISAPARRTGPYPCAAKRLVGRW